MNYASYLAAGNNPVESVSRWKELCVAHINAECESRILAKWSLPKQISAQAGLHGATAKANCDVWILGHVNVADAAQLAIDAVVDSGNLDNDIAAIDAIVAAVVWPVWGV